MKPPPIKYDVIQSDSAYIVYAGRQVVETASTYREAVDAAIERVYEGMKKRKEGR
jgi:hypothetical protein